MLVGPTGGGKTKIFRYDVVQQNKYIYPYIGDQVEVAMS